MIPRGLTLREYVFSRFPPKYRFIDLECLGCGGSGITGEEEFMSNSGERMTCGVCGYEDNVFMFFRCYHLD